MVRLDAMWISVLINYFKIDQLYLKLVKQLRSSRFDSIKSNLKSIDTLFLDFDGTIVDYNQNESSALDAILDPIGLSPDQFEKAKKEYRRINIQLWKEFERNQLEIEEVRRRRFKQLGEVLNMEFNGEVMNTRYISNFIKHVNPYPGVIEKLTTFKQKFQNFHYTIVTNGTHNVQIDRLKNIGALDLMDNIVSSTKVGVSKPDKEIFDFALSESGKTRDQVMMIGDSMTSDIKGAHQYGLMSCLISSSVPSDPEYTPDFVSSSLNLVLDNLTKIKNQ